MLQVRPDQHDGQDSHADRPERPHQPQPGEYHPEHVVTPTDRRRHDHRAPDNEHPELVVSRASEQSALVQSEKHDEPGDREPQATGQSGSQQKSLGGLVVHVVQVAEPSLHVEHGVGPVLRRVARKQNQREPTAAHEHGQSSPAVTCPSARQQVQHERQRSQLDRRRNAKEDASFWHEDIHGCQQRDERADLAEAQVQPAGRGDQQQGVTREDHGPPDSRTPLLPFPPREHDNQEQQHNERAGRPQCIGPALRDPGQRPHHEHREGRIRERVTIGRPDLVQRRVVGCRVDAEQVDVQVSLALWQRVPDAHHALPRRHHQRQPRE